MSQKRGRKTQVQGEDFTLGAESKLARVREGAWVVLGCEPTAGEHSSYILSLQGMPATDTLLSLSPFCIVCRWFRIPLKGFVQQKPWKIEMEPPLRTQNTLTQPRE